MIGLLAANTRDKTNVPAERGRLRTPHDDVRSLPHYPCSPPQPEIMPKHTYCCVFGAEAYHTGPRERGKLDGARAMLARALIRSRIR